MKVIVNSKVIDYNGGLPFSFKVSLRDLTTIGGVDSVELSNESKVLSLPCTALNERSIPKEGIFNVYVEDRGLPIFNGVGRYLSTVKEYGSLSVMNIDVWGSASVILDRLEGLEVKDLDLSYQFYNAIEQEGSWLSGPAVWAPVSYGELTSKQVDDWSFQDLRPSVKLVTLMEGIANYLGIRITGSILSSPIFRSSCLLYTVGSKWKVYDTLEDNIQVANGSQTSLTFNPSNIGRVKYKVNLHIQSFGVVALKDIEVTIGTFVDILSYTGSEFVIDYEKEIEVGSTISIRGLDTNGNPINLPTLSSMQSVMSAEVIEGSAVDLSSCVDMEVKDLLRGIFLMFNLSSVYNTVTKEWTLASVFRHTIDSIDYEGFYKLSEGTNRLEVINDSLVYSNPLNKAIIELEHDSNERYDNLLPVDSSQYYRVYLKGEGKQTVKTPFKRLYNGTVNGLTNKEFPILLNPEIDLTAPSYSIQAANFEFDGNFIALNTGETVTITYEGLSKNVPLLRQTNRNINYKYSLSFSDVIVGGIRIQGLGSLFYEQHFSMLDGLTIVQGDLRRFNYLTDVLRSSIRMEGQHYLIFELDGIQMNSNRVSFKAIRYANKRITTVIEQDPTNINILRLSL